MSKRAHSALRSLAFALAALLALGGATFADAPGSKEYKEKVIVPMQDELNAKYNNDVPYDERVKFYNSIDGEIYNGFNPELIELINSFFEKAA